VAIPKLISMGKCQTQSSATVVQTVVKPSVSDSIRSTIDAKSLVNKFVKYSKAMLKGAVYVGLLAVVVLLTTQWSASSEPRANGLSWSIIPRFLR
jgi:hypothetical protein